MLAGRELKLGVVRGSPHRFVGDTLGARHPNFLLRIPDGLLYQRGRRPARPALGRYFGGGTQKCLRINSLLLNDATWPSMNRRLAVVLAKCRVRTLSDGPGPVTTSRLCHVCRMIPRSFTGSRPRMNQNLGEPAASAFSIETEFVPAAA